MKTTQFWPWDMGGIRRRCSSGKCALNLIAATLSVLTVSCGRQVTVSAMADTNVVNGVHLSEYQRVAYWNSLLQQHPDLPSKVKRAAEMEGIVETRQSDITGTKITIHSYLGAVTVSAESISAIVTDLDNSSLLKLLAYWQTISARARELGILTTTPKADMPRVVVLGRDGRIDIQGPRGSESQTIDVYHEFLTGQANIAVHSFGEKGSDAVASILDYYRRVNQNRGPPHADVKAGKYDRPPPDVMPVVVIGKLKELNIQGPADFSTQKVTFEEYVNSFTEMKTTQEVVEFAKAGERAFHMTAAAVTAAAIAVAAAKKQSESSRPSGGYRPSGGPRRGGGARPGR